jgi:hypothetical protein
VLLASGYPQALGAVAQFRRGDGVLGSDAVGDGVGEEVGDGVGDGVGDVGDDVGDDVVDLVGVGVGAVPGEKTTST